MRPEDVEVVVGFCCNQARTTAVKYRRETNAMRVAAMESGVELFGLDKTKFDLLNEAVIDLAHGRCIMHRHEAVY